MRGEYASYFLDEGIRLDKKAISPGKLREKEEGR